jgi:hypothetical protein
MYLVSLLSKIDALIDKILDEHFNSIKTSLEKLGGKTAYQITGEDFSRLHRDLASIKEELSAANDYFKKVTGVQHDAPNFWDVVSGVRGIDQMIREISLAGKFLNESKFESDSEKRQGFERLAKLHIMNTLRCVVDTEPKFMNFVEHLKLVKALSTIPIGERQRLAKELQECGMQDILVSLKTAEDAFYRKDFRGSCANCRIVLESMIQKLVEKLGEPPSKEWKKDIQSVRNKAILDDAISGMVGSLWDLLSRMGSHPISPIDEKMGEYCFLQTVLVTSHLLWTYQNLPEASR